MEQYFYDFHTHILPGVDDGAPSMEVTKQMLALAHLEGIHTIIATPHYNSAKGQDVKKLKELTEKVKEEAKKISSDLIIYLGNELYYSDSIVTDLKAGIALSLAGSRYVLVEFSTSETYSAMFKGLGDLVRAGYAPILAHVERYECLYKKEELILELIELGTYIQMNCASISGGIFNSKSSYNKKLINKGLIHFLSSDCHDTVYRKPLFFSVISSLKGKIQQSRLDSILVQNPKMLLENKYI